MNDTDDAISRLVRQLRETEPPPGMNRRILKRLEQEAASQHRSRRALWGLISISAPHRPARLVAWAAGLTLSALLAIAILVPRSRLAGHAPTEANPARADGRQRSVAPHLGTPETARPLISETQPAERHRAKKPATNPEIQEVAALHVSNQPAPPMPLTDQERLLLRIAHRADPKQLATVSSEVLTAHRAEEEQAEFQKFFGPAATPANP